MSKHRSPWSQNSTVQTQSMAEMQYKRHKEKHSLLSQIAWMRCVLLCKGQGIPATLGRPFFHYSRRPWRSTLS